MPPAPPPLPCCADPDAIACPPSVPLSLQDVIPRMLSAIGLNESSTIDSNTPLEIIRHFAGLQTYDQALGGVLSSTVVVAILGLALFMISSSQSKYHRVGILLMVPAICWRVIWGVAAVYGLSAASVLLNDIKPLLAREFVIVGLWGVSAILATLKAIAFVLLAWGAIRVLEFMVEGIRDLAYRLSGWR